MKIIYITFYAIIITSPFSSLYSSKPCPNLRQKSFILFRPNESIQVKSQRSQSLLQPQKSNNFDIFVELVNQGKIEQALSMCEAQARKQNLIEKTFLHYAAIHNMNKVLSLLLNTNIQKDKIDSQGCTALHYAAMNINQNSVITLMNANVNTQIKDQSGRTALHYAAIYQRTNNIHLLKDSININAQDNNGKTALHYAVINNTYSETNGKESHVHVTEYLIQQGAFSDIVDNEGKTPLYYAVTSNFKSFNILNSLLRPQAVNLSLYYRYEGDLFNIAALHWPECIEILAKKDLALFIPESEKMLPPQINFSQE